ncbi:MAG: myo-inosose-2 dehydratase [Promethearchaeota archaeon]
MINKDDVQLGISPIGWTNDDLPKLGGNISFKQCIQEISQADFIGTEIGSKFPTNEKILKEQLSQFKLKIASQWFSSYFTFNPKIQETISKFKEYIRRLKYLGAKVIVVSEQGGSIQKMIHMPIFGQKPILDEKGWQNLADGLNFLGDIAQKEGIKISYHHHMGTVIQTEAEIKKLMELTNPDTVGLLVDTGHCFLAEIDPIKLMREYGSRINHIHLKDCRTEIIKKVKIIHLSFLEGIMEGIFTVPGDGIIKFDQIFKYIDSLNYKGWLIVEAEQDPKRKPPLIYAQKARKYIKNISGL